MCHAGCHQSDEPKFLVLQEGVDAGEFEPIKIPEEDNAADVYTKYLVFQKWKRHTTSSTT